MHANTALNCVVNRCFDVRASMRTKTQWFNTQLQHVLASKMMILSDVAIAGKNCVVNHVGNQHLRLRSNFT